MVLCGPSEAWLSRTLTENKVCFELTLTGLPTYRGFESSGEPPTPNLLFWTNHILNDQAAVPELVRFRVGNVRQLCNARATLTSPPWCSSLSCIARIAATVARQKLRGHLSLMLSASSLDHR